MGMVVDAFDRYDVTVLVEERYTPATHNSTVGISSEDDSVNVRGVKLTELWCGGAFEGFILCEDEIPTYQVTSNLFSNAFGSGDSEGNILIGVLIVDSTASK